MFQVGDQIVYPLHGVGYIKAIEEKEILGENRTYYIVCMPRTNMQIMIPKDKATSVGVRKPVEPSVFDDIIYNFDQGPTDPQLFKNQRYCNELNKKRIKSGDIYKGIEIIRDLTRKSHLSKLGKDDTKMLEDARYMFITELMHVRSLSEEKATDLLDSLLESEIIVSENEITEAVK